jgi:REP element-mobilizing transposase RayT
MSDEVAFYRRNLPHYRAAQAIYFVTWRRRLDQADISEMERYEVVASLRWFEGRRYRLHGYVVMNDHVHVMVEPIQDWKLQKILHSWKSFTANKLQRLCGRRGSVWQDEYFDRVIRNEREYREKRDYILDNPQKRWPDVADYPWVWAIGLD